MIERSNTSSRKDKISELIMLFSSLPYHKREIVLEIAKLMSEKKRDN